MREGIQRLVALPKPPKVSKAHHFDGLVTWKSNERNGDLDPDFQYRASSIWRLVTRDLTGAELSHCAGYTPDHIHSVVQWFRSNSTMVKPGETAEAVKTAFKESFGCMRKDCVSRGNPAYDVDHVNPAFKTECFGHLIKKRKNGKSLFSSALVCRELLGTQVLCVQCHRQSKDRRRALIE
jgi:hypothetical protein